MKNGINGVLFIILGILITFISIILICDGIHVLSSYDKEKAKIVKVNKNKIEVEIVNDDSSCFTYVINKKLFQKKGDIISLYFSKTEEKRPVNRPISYIYVFSLLVGIVGIYKGSMIYKGKKKGRKK